MLDSHSESLTTICATKPLVSKIVDPDTNCFFLIQIISSTDQKKNSPTEAAHTVRRVLMISASVLTTLATPVKSQEILYELVDSGVLTDPKRGQGIEMRVKPNIEPRDGFYGEINQHAMPNICNHYAPFVIPFITDKFEMIEPEFIAVRLVSSSSSFGRYILEFYAIENGTCGGKL